MILKRPLVRVGKPRLVLNSLIFIILISFGLIKNLEAAEKRNKVEADIIGINQEMGFFIISAGEKEGLNIGNKVIIFNNEKNEIGKGQIIEVQKEVSAGEVVSPQGLILKEGYRTVIYPFEKNFDVAKKERPKWTPLFHAKAIPETTQTTQSKEGFYGSELRFSKTGESINLEINSDLRKVFPFAIQVLSNNGYSITHSNRFAGLINATKGITLALPSELWADLIAAIDHKVLLTLNIKERGNITNLSISAITEHTQKGGKVMGFIGKGSEFYREILKIASEIKEFSEAK